MPEPAGLRAQRFGPQGPVWSLSPRPAVPRVVQRHLWRPGGVGQRPGPAAGGVVARQSPRPVAWPDAGRCQAPLGELIPHRASRESRGTSGRPGRLRCARRRHARIGEGPACSIRTAMSNPRRDRDAVRQTQIVGDEGHRDLSLARCKLFHPREEFAIRQLSHRGQLMWVHGLVIPWSFHIAWQRLQWTTSRRVLFSAHLSCRNVLSHGSGAR